MINDNDIVHHIANAILALVKGVQPAEPAPCAHPLDLPPGVDPGPTSARDYYHNTANRLMMENAQLKIRVEELTHTKPPMPAEEWTNVLVEYAKIKGKNAELRQQVADQETRINAVEDRRRALEAEAYQQSQALNERAARILHLEGDRGALREQIKELTQDRDHWKAKVEGLPFNDDPGAEIIHDIKGLFAQVQSRADSKLERMAWNESSLASNLAYISDRIHALLHLTSNISPLTRHIDSLKVEVSKRADIIAQKEARISALEGQVKDQTHIITQNERDIEAKRMIIASRDRIAEADEARLIQFSRSLAEISVILHGSGPHKVDVDQIKNSIISLKARVEDQTRIIGEKNKSLAEQEDMIKNLRQANMPAAFRHCFNEMQAHIHQNAKDHGWHNNGTYSIVDQLGVFISNVHAELSEAWEVVRRNYMEDSKNVPGHLALVEELADVVIRIMDTCQSKNWDLADCILKKHEYNKTRPHRHGGKQA
jgi:chromosome segregation ATPase